MSKAKVQAKRIANHMIGYEGMVRVWDTTFENEVLDRARVSFKVKTEMRNVFKAIHGELFYALAGLAIAYACN